MYDQHQVAESETAPAQGAWSKSAEIILRSSRIWSAALFGLSSMTLEDAFDAARARISCTTLVALAELERDLAPCMLARAFGRFCLLITIAIQIGEEAGYPLRHWIFVELEKLASSLRA